MLCKPFIYLADLGHSNGFVADPSKDPTKYYFLKQTIFVWVPLLGSVYAHLWDGSCWSWALQKELHVAENHCLQWCKKTIVSMQIRSHYLWWAHDNGFRMLSAWLPSKDLPYAIGSIIWQLNSMGCLHGQPHTVEASLHKGPCTKLGLTSVTSWTSKRWCPSEVAGFRDSISLREMALASCTYTLEIYMMSS